MSPYMADCVAKLGNLLGRGFPSAGDEGETVDVLGFIILCLSETFFSGEEVIDFGLRLVVGGLCAPFTVFGASAGFGVDDGAQVELVRSTRDGNLMCGGIKRLAVGHIGQPSGLLGRYINACQHLVFNFLKCHKCMIRDSLCSILLTKGNIDYIGMQMSDTYFAS